MTASFAHTQAARDPNGKTARRTLTINLRDLDEQTAIYLVDLLSEYVEDGGPFGDACEKAAFDLAGNAPDEPFGPTQDEIANEIYPQDATYAEWVRWKTEYRDPKLRAAGILKENSQ